MTFNNLISYEEYSRKMNSYEAAVKRLGARMHQLSPDHPIRKHLKHLVSELKALPEDVLTDYLKRRHKELFTDEKEALIYKS